MSIPLIYAALGLRVDARLRAARHRSEWSVEQVRGYQLEKLNRLMSRLRAKSRTLDLYPSLRARTAPFSSLEEFTATIPVLEKSKLRQHDARIAGVRRFGVIVRETAGTTGQVTTVALSRELLAMQFAARALAMEWHGLALGDREGRLWGRRSSQPTVSLIDRVLGRRVIGCMSTESELREGARRLASFDPVYLYGYSSQLVALAPWIAKHRQRFGSLRAAICTAESLMDWQRDHLEAQLGVPVLREYGCTETDIIAFECRRRRYHIMVDRCLVEVPRDGAAAAEILLTDLDNDLTPLLRYRLGDVVKLSSADCDCGVSWPVIDSIEGRTLNQYVVLPSGYRVHAVTFAHMTEAMVRGGIPVRQFRVTQVARDYLDVALDCEHSEQSSVAIDFVREWVHRNIHSQLRVDVRIGEIQSVPGRKSHYFQSLSELT